MLHCLKQGCQRFTPCASAPSFWVTSFMTAALEEKSGGKQSSRHFFFALYCQCADKSIRAVFPFRVLIAAISPSLQERRRSRVWLGLKGFGVPAKFNSQSVQGCCWSVKGEKAMQNRKDSSLAQTFIDHRIQSALHLVWLLTFIVLSLIGTAVKAALLSLMHLLMHLYSLLLSVFKNPVCKVYRFQTADSKWMLVREQMEECTLSFSVPKQLLSLYIQEDTSR